MTFTTISNISTAHGRTLIAVIFFNTVVAGCTSSASAPLITPLPSQQPSAITSVTSTYVSADTSTNATPPNTPIITATPTALATAITPTPTAQNNALAAGTARDIAIATDTALRPTPRTRIDFGDTNVQAVPIKFSEFYDGYDIRRGLKLSDKLVSLDDQRVAIEGYMAPPLKPELDFFVLTRIRLAFCPFCSTAADWPDDIALVYLPPDQTILATTNPVRLTGRMEVGQSRDAETGMVSLVRIYADNLEILQ